ncbi:MAG: 16S rRNA (cytosine(1402)-N(4))-methyltransferase RsmH [Acidobacteriales bacterium]|nr:16S rRNA (cytosine(1402)-N(4))-methyltransferase RsmH [Terriglobales bacterium]
MPERGGHGGKRESGHVPVLLQQAIEFLNIKRGGRYIDATVGLGGHSFEIAKRLGAPGHLIGFDKDPAALEIAQQRLTQDPASLARDGSARDWPTITLIHGTMGDSANSQRASSVDGILADLGVSSLQLNDPARGFSFQAEGPLDMRMNPQSGPTAEQVVNQSDEVTLANLIYEFGDERRSRRIARAIVRSRPIGNTAQLAEIISAAARPMNPAERKIHPATRTFQAIRIFVNDELNHLQALLSAAPQLLKSGGRLVIISFQSLEDRIVKDALRDGAKSGIYRLLVKKPVVAEAEEVVRNSRARSAKLRAAERL